MTTQQPQRYGGLLGVAGGVLGLLGAFTMVTLEFMPDAGDAVATFTDDTGRILGGGQLLVLGAVLVAAFGAVVQKHIRAVAGDTALSTAAASGYAMAALSALVSVAAYAGGALRVDANGEISEAQATTMADIGMVLIGSVTPVALALGVGATSIAALRFRTFVPRWLGGLGVAIAAGLLILPINWAVLPVGVLWTIAAGVAFSSTGSSIVDLSEERDHALVGG